MKAPGHELVLVYLTSSQHGSVASTLAKAAELARSTKVVVVREKRFDFPSTWETVRERRSTFERLPNARWLWLEREDLGHCLTLARLLSKARAKKLDVAGSDEPLSLDRVREAILGERAPTEWESVELITRWLSDVPRETVAAGREVQHAGVGPGVEARPSPAAASPPSAPLPARGIPLPSEAAAPPTLRTWLSLGRELGRSAVSRYLRRARTLVGRE